MQTFLANQIVSLVNKWRESSSKVLMLHRILTKSKYLITILPVTHSNLRYSGSAMADTQLQRQVIETEKAPKPVGPYSQAIKVGSTVYLSGQIHIDPLSGKLIDGTFDEKATQVFKNLEAVALAAGGTLKDVVKMTIFITDFDNYKAVNSVMEKYFSKPYPARSCVAVKSLPLGVPLEIEAIMVLPSGKL